jgi:hypothetical protein
MSNILKISATTTLEVSSDILNKDAGALVKDAIVQATPIILDAIKENINPTPKASNDKAKG